MTVLNGYMGKLLFVDLTNGKIREEALDSTIARQFVGGYGVGARIILERMKPGTDPLGPDNIFGVGTGPFHLPVYHHGKVPFDRVLGGCQQWRQFCQCPSWFRV